MRVKAHALKAHAKVNLGLSVLARRGDGFHEIDTLMARVALHDTLTLAPIPAGIRLEVSGAALPADRGNLVYRAAEGYREGAGISQGVSIGLEKQIPVAAGLGGGSSDAGAALRGLSELYPAEVKLLELAEQLGSDVPFFALDLPAARARGRGERLEPVKLPELHLVLVNPGVAVRAGDAYASLESVTPPLEPDALLARLEAGGEPGYLNALQAGVVRRQPVVGEVLATLRAAGLRGVLMSGSGSTCFGLAAASGHAEGIAATLAEAHPEWWVRATRTV